MCSSDLIPTGAKLNSLPIRVFVVKLALIPAVQSREEGKALRTLISLQAVQLGCAAGSPCSFSSVHINFLVTWVR